MQVRLWLLEAESAHGFTTAKYFYMGARETAVRQELLKCKNDYYPFGVTISSRTIQTQIDFEIANKETV